MQNSQPMDNDFHEPTQLDEFVERLEPILKHITPHRFLWGFTLICAFVAWNRGLMLLYGLVSFLLAVLIISHLFRIFNLRGLAIQGVFITEKGVVAQDNDEIFIDEPVAMQLNTSSSFAKHFIHVEASVYRVTQVSTSSILNKVQDTRLFILHTKGQEEFDNDIRLKRGVYRLQSAHLRCAYPFGLLQTNKVFDLHTGNPVVKIKGLEHETNEQINNNQTDLYVLPRWFSITSLPVETAHSSGQDELTSSKKGGCDEFVEIRPYRRGDPFKTVHWGASARQISRGKDFMVKEYATFDTPRMIIVLNQFDIANHISMDAMIATTLSIASYYARIGHQVDLFGYDGSSESINDFWHMSINKSISQDKLRKLAEIDSINNYVLPDSGNNGSHDKKFSNSVLKNANYNDALQNILSNQANANVLLTFYSQSPSQNIGGASISQMVADKTHYHVVINRQNKQATQQNPNYIKRSNFTHEFQLNAHESLAEWEAVFNNCSS